MPTAHESLPEEVKGRTGMSLSRENKGFVSS